MFCQNLQQNAINDQLFVQFDQSHCQSWGRYEITCHWDQITIDEYLQAEYKLQMKKHNEFSTIIHTTIKICEFFAGAVDNVAFKWVIELFRDSIPDGMLHACPYREVKAYNLSIHTNHSISQSVKGTYHSSIRFFDDEDANIATVNHDVELMSMNLRKPKVKAWNLRHACLNKAQYLIEWTNYFVDRWSSRWSKNSILFCVIGNKDVEIRLRLINFYRSSVNFRWRITTSSVP